MKNKNRFNLAKTGNHLDIYLYGIIGGWDVDLQSFMTQLKSVENPETVTVYLNSLGGTFYDGIPIFTHLGMLEAKLTINIMGYAISMASVIALAPGATVRMAQNGAIMHHRALTYVYGNANDLEKEIEVLKVFEAGVVKLYAQRLGITENQALALMDAETWYTADQALAAGLVDEIIDPIDLTDAVKNAASGKSANDSVLNYRNMPPDLNALLPAKKPVDGFWQQFFGKKTEPMPAPNPLVNEPPSLHGKISMTPEEIKALFEQNNTSLLAAIDTKLAEHSNAINSEVEKLKQKSPEELKDERINQLEAELAGLQKPDKDARIAQLEAEIAELRTPDKPTKVPENTGGNDDKPKYDC